MSQNWRRIIIIIIRNLRPLLTRYNLSTYTTQDDLYHPGLIFCNGWPGGGRQQQQHQQIKEVGN